MIQDAPNQMAKLQVKFSDQLPPVWQKHGIDAIGFWTTFMGASSSELTYMLQETLADFEASWAALTSYPAWHKVRAESECDGAIAASISNQAPTPTAFLAFK
jgi:NIPSNAP